MATPTFKNMSDEEYPIDNFVVQGASDAKTVIQVLDTDGQVSGTYYWYNAFGEYPAGWFDFSGLTPAGITLKSGEGVFFYTSESGVSILSAGEVLGDVTREISGYAMIGNCRPTNLPVDDLSIQGATDAKTVMQVLDEEGQVSGTYYWYNAFGEYPAGWFDFAGLVSAGINLNPGDAVFFYTSENGVTATIPGAL